MRLTDVAIKLNGQISLLSTIISNVEGPQKQELKEMKKDLKDIVYLINTPPDQPSGERESG